MRTSVIKYLENAYMMAPHKLAFVDGYREMTYEALRNEAMHIAESILAHKVIRAPIAIYLPKSVECVAAFFGAVYSGNFYSPIDTDMPKSRVEKILDTLCPRVVVTDRDHADDVKTFGRNCRIIVYEDALEAECDFETILHVNRQVIDTDVLYILFTSGSTGNPKGVTISQRALIDFIEWGKEYFCIDSDYVFGNQTPFYFSMSVFDIYETVANAATTYIIPHDLFSFPVKLMAYLDENKVNTLFWVPSALTMISALRALSSPHLNNLKRILFGGEVMPMKQLNRWIREYPDIDYFNMYGPTEVTDTCTVFKVNRHFTDSETLPIGDSCDNMDVFLLDDNDALVIDDKVGELCVRGSGISYGYYNDRERTKVNFVQNPLNNSFAEIIYRTGDLAKMNEFGEFIYVSRKDFQIKHMGHRIELGEIETAASSIEGVEMACCLHSSDKDQITLVFTGEQAKEQLSLSLSELIPTYMMPNKIVKIHSMPLNLNGKVDRQLLKEQCI